MSTTLKVRIEGLYTSPNALSASPPGALAQADDIIIPDQSVAEPRVGFEEVSELSAADRHAVSLGYHRNETLLVAEGDTTTTGGDAVGYVSGGTYTGYDGVYEPVDEDLGRVHFTNADDLTFLSTALGCFVVDDHTDEPRAAGMPPALPIYPESAGLTELQNDSGWLEYGASVTYRTVLARRDSSGRVVRSRPSPSHVIENRLLIPVGGMTRAGTTVTITTTKPHGLMTSQTFTLDPGEANFASGVKTITGGTTYTITYTEAGAAVSSTAEQDVEPSFDRSTRITGVLPLSSLVDIRVGDYVELYRSPQTPLGTTPSEELFKCAEMPLTTSQLGTVDFTFYDIAPESSLIEPLYSNQNTGNGTPNEQPPIAQDSAWWDDRLWFGNTNSKQRITVELVGVGPDDGLQSGDTITINGVEFTASAAFTSTTFPLYDDDDLPSVNIDRTLENICHTIDYAGLYITEDFYVFKDGPKLLIESIRPDAEPFTFWSDRAEAWSPQCEEDTPITSLNDDNQHWLFYSQPGEPEHVPLLNYLPVGSKNDPIRRVFGFRDRLFVFKKTEGVFCVTGPFPYRVTQVSNANLVSSETVGVLGEQVWGLFDQGVASISDAGITVVSRAIEDTLQQVVELMKNDPDQHYVPFAVCQESTRQYHLWVPKADGTNDRECYVYNLGTNTWVRWTTEATAGVLDQNADRLVLGDTNVIKQQRQNVPSYNRNQNYADESWDFPNCTTSGTTLTLPETADAPNIAAGGLIVYNGNPSKVVSVTAGSPNYTIVLAGSLYVTSPDTVTYYTPINSVIRYHPFDLGDPGVNKNWQELQLIWGAALSTGVLAFSTDVKPTPTSYTFTNRAGWGVDQFGSGFWGGYGATRTRVAPIPHQYSTAGSLIVKLTSNAAWAPFRLFGMRLEAEGGTEESIR